MTLSEAISFLTTHLAYDLDFVDGEAPTDAQKIAHINHAQRNIGKRLRLFEPSQSLTVVDGTSSYDLRALSSPVIEPLAIYRNGTALKRPDGTPGLWGFNELETIHPGWRNWSSGTPTKAVLTGSSKIILTPTPNASAAGDTWVVSGMVLPEDFETNGTDDSEAIRLPVELHEACAYLAAQLASFPTATEDEQWGRIQAFNSAWMGIVKEEAAKNRNAVQAFHPHEWMGHDRILS